MGRTRRGGITDSRPFKSTHREVFKRPDFKIKCIQIHPEDTVHVHEYAELSVHLFGLTEKPTTFTACFFYVFETCTESPKRFVFFKLERHPSSSKKHWKNAARRYVRGDKSFQYDGVINGESQDKKNALDAPTFREDEVDKYEQKLASYHWDEPNFTFDELYATVNDLQKALQEEDQSFALPNREDTISWFAYFLRHMTFLHLYHYNKTSKEFEKIQWGLEHQYGEYHMWRGPAKGTWIIQDDDSSVFNFLMKNDLSSIADPNSALHEDDATITEDVKFYNENIRTGNEIFIPGSVHVIERFRTFISYYLPRILSDTRISPHEPPGLTPIISELSHGEPGSTRKRRPCLSQIRGNISGTITLS